MVDEKERTSVVPVICPVAEEDIDVTACDALLELQKHLQSGRSVIEPTAFQKGTLLPDGRLDLCKQDLGPAGIKLVAEAMKSNEIVKHVLLGTNAMGSAGAVAVSGLIEQNNSLNTVYLGCNLIESEGVTRLAHAIATSSTVTALWLKRNPIGQGGFEAIADLLRHSQTLKVLDLVNTGVNRGALEIIVSSLTEGSPALEHLYLGGNGLSACEADLLRELLAKNESLRGLYLSVNQLGDDGVRSLSVGLKNNRKLEVLGLAANGITTDGFTHLNETLSQHAELKVLDLGIAPSAKTLKGWKNCIGDRGAMLLAETLATGSKLVSCNLEQNQVSLPGATNLRDALVQNRTVRELRLDLNRIPRTLSNEIHQLCLSNGNGVPLPIDYLREHISAIRSVYR